MLRLFRRGSSSASSTFLLWTCRSSAKSSHLGWQGRQGGRREPVKAEGLTAADNILGAAFARSKKKDAEETDAASRPRSRTPA